MEYRSTLFIVVLAALVAGDTHPLEVDIDEFKNIKKVEFVNYKGPNKREDPLNEIFGIGRTLAEGSKTRYQEPFRYLMKYSVTRAVSKDEPEKLSADIISIDKDAQVDHIDNVRRITAGYLTEMYGYTHKQAWALAVFISYYNAVHRGDMDYFSSVYKKGVMKNIDARNAGISTKYSDWPGATKMLVPLTEAAKRGGIDAIDPFALTDEKTKKEIRKDDRITERKDIVDLKDKAIAKDKAQLDAKKGDIEKKKGDIEKDKKVIDDKKAAIDREKEDAAKKEEALRKEKEAAARITDTDKRKEKEDEIARKEKEAAAEKEKIRKDEKELGEKEKAVEKKTEALKKDEKDAAVKEDALKKKEDAVKEEKKEIAKDDTSPEGLKKKEADLAKKETELDKREDSLRSKTTDKNIYADKLYYLKIREYLEGGHYNNEMFLIDAAERKVVLKSPVATICGSRYDVFSDGIVVITHAGSHAFAHHLTLIDREKLTVKITGTENVFWRSFVEIREGYIYAIIIKDGKYYLGKFDGTLALAASSRENISENTFLSFFGDYLYINKMDRTVIVLNKNDLSLIDTIKP
ncbi:MAG: P83/100 family protein [Spirochaetota bacterium]